LKNLILIIFVVFLIPTAYGQSIYKGKYVKYYGNTIQISSDSTFKYVTGYPQFFWANGIWRTSNDTIYFAYVPIYDTLFHNDTLQFKDSPKRVKVYTFELSCDEISNMIIRDQSQAPGCITRQRGDILPEKLYYIKNVLYDIYSEGKIIKKKYKNQYGIKKISSGYLKTEN
jgi:hypothetical protein